MNINQFIISFLCLIIGSCLLTGCQYQFGYGDLPNRYSTITVPYVEGDIKGELTAEVIKKLSSSGALTYVSYGGDLTLKINLWELSDENIGFRYDRNKRGHLKKYILPAETRLEAIAEVVIIETATNKIIRGPAQIKASIDFDHDYYSSRHAVNIFSLGQLSDIDVAQDTAMHPLNQRLAEKISDYVINSW